jgi:dienelactone hydrolase
VATFLDSVTLYGNDVISAGEDHVWIGQRLPQLAPLCLMLHGANQTSYALAATMAPTYVASLRAAGFVVLAIDASGIQNWGNDASATAIDAALDWAEDRAGADTSNGIATMGFSMGNLTILNWAKQSTANRAKVAAYAGIIPALDIDDIHDFNRSGSASHIETAYGGLAAYNAAEPTHNPSRYPEYYTFPGRLWSSSNDTVCLPAITAAFGAGAGMDVVTFGAVGHAITGLDPDDVTEFLRESMAQ